MCLAQPMMTTSSLSARSHSVVRVRWAVSACRGSGMAKSFSGSATSRWDTMMLEEPGETSEKRNLGNPSWQPAQSSLFNSIQFSLFDGLMSNTFKKRPKLLRGPNLGSKPMTVYTGDFLSIMNPVNVKPSTGRSSCPNVTED